MTLEKAFYFGPHKICPTQIFYGSRFAYGLVNLKPIVPGHVLVVSKRSVARFTDLTPEEVSDLFVSAQSIGRVVEKEFQGESLSVVVQDGPYAGQTVPHVHIHVIPRRQGDWENNDDIYDDLNKVDNEDRKPRSATEMAEEANRLRERFPQSE
ncbi:Dinucleoside triphosphate hydrolase [Basidiobolus ranarum]|uniref:Bis(5'-adenosyl)-triphosphatase n=1 Tax=Basidiobolus ranarum TaxID=34480 RepID=A0ABR2WYF7_9FUNG